MGSDDHSNNYLMNEPTFSACTELNEGQFLKFDDKLVKVRCGFPMDIKAINVNTVSGGSSSTSGKECIYFDTILLVYFVI